MYICVYIYIQLYICLIICVYVCVSIIPSQSYQAFQAFKISSQILFPANPNTSLDPCEACADCVCIRASNLHAMQGGPVDSASGKRLQTTMV